MTYHLCRTRSCCVIHHLYAKVACIYSKAPYSIAYKKGINVPTDIALIIIISKT